MRLRTVSLAALLALGGCTDEPEALATAGAFCREHYALVTSLAASCGWMPELAALEYERAVPFCDAPAASSVRYDRDAAERCLETLRTASCTFTGTALEAACEGVLAGTLPEGAPCVHSLECEGADAECVDPELACGGTCLSAGTSGDRCGPTYPDCAPGHYCSTATTPATCETAWPEGTACTTDPARCGTGAYCDPDPAVGCRSYAALGESCASRRCDDRAAIFCDSLEAGTGTPLCRPWHALADGQLCSQSVECGAESYCAGSPRRCVRMSGVGAACSGDEECMPPLACVGDATGLSGACSPRRATGESCTPGSRDCLVGAACVGPAGSASCEAWPDALGAACASGPDRGCLAGRCAPDGQGGQSCQEFLPPGAACTWSHECGGGHLIHVSAWCSDGASDERVCIPGCL